MLGGGAARMETTSQSIVACALAQATRAYLRSVCQASAARRPIRRISSTTADRATARITAAAAPAGPRKVQRRPIVLQSDQNHSRVKPNQTKVRPRQIAA